MPYRRIHFLLTKDVPYKYDYCEDLKVIGTGLAGGLAFVLSVPIVYKKILEISKNRKIGEFVEKYNALPEESKKLIKKKLICEYFNGEKVEITKENLKKLPIEELKKLLGYIKDLEVNSK